MKRLIFLMLALLVAGSASAATKVQVMTDGVIDTDRLKTIPLLYETDPASPALGQIWWNNATNQLKVAGALGVYVFNSTSLSAWDTTPEAFSFTDVTDATTSTVYTSAPITVSGINWPAAISVSGDASAKYSVNNATAMATAGTVSSGDEVRAVVTSSASDGTAVNATVTIGGVSGAYSVTTVAGGGDVSCSGSITDGDNESFESGAGEFCTTGWTITGSTGLNTYSDTWANTGSHSMSMTDSSSTNGPLVYAADFGSAITSKYVRFYVKTDTIADYVDLFLGGFAQYDTGGGQIGNLHIRSNEDGTTAKLRLESSATEYFTITEGAELRIEIKAEDVGSSSTATMRVYELQGESWVQLSTNNSNTDLVYSSAVSEIRYFSFMFNYDAATAKTFYIDDVQFANTWIGE